MIVSNRKTAAAYFRVSTGRQLINDLSLPDQRKRCFEWAEANNCEIVEEFHDAASGRTDARPGFQALMEKALRPDRPYTQIVTHSISRMFRNAEDMLSYRNRLRRNKVKIVSITQAFGDDAGGDFALGVLALGDEYTSRETAKHVSRAMLANAEAGFSNGQRPPIGYVAVEAERRGQKIKKKFAINEAEVGVVRTLYDLYLKGVPGDGRALGITSVASELNRRGLRYRGHHFAVSNVHFVLTNTAYRGVAYYNKRCSATLEQRPQSEWVGVPVPAIIDEADWYAVQAKLQVSNPRKTPPRVVSGPTILVGLAVCGCDDDGCKGGMTISTGKSGAYKYYACSRRARMGTTACAGRRISMPTLDELVMTTLTNAVLAPDRLPVLLAACLERSESADRARTANLKSLRAQKSGADALLGGLYRTAAMVEGGIDKVMKVEIDSARNRIATLDSEIDLVERQFSGGSQRITPEIIERFGSLLRHRLDGSDPTFRQSYARLLIDRVEVGRQRIRIVGSKTALAKCIAASNRHPNEVPSFERRWCTRRESNPRPAV